jgi:hypothetical protein
MANEELNQSVDPREGTQIEGAGEAANDDIFKRVIGRQVKKICDRKKKLCRKPLNRRTAQTAQANK